MLYIMGCSVGFILSINNQVQDHFYNCGLSKDLFFLPFTQNFPFLQDYAVDWRVSLYVYPQYGRCAILPILLYSSMLLAYFATKFIGQFPVMSIVSWYGLDIKLVWNWADLLKHKHTAFGDSWFQATQLEPNIDGISNCLNGKLCCCQQQLLW